MELNLNTVQLADVPPDLFSALSSVEAESIKTEPAKFVLDGVCKGQRDEAVFKYACQLREKKLSPEEIKRLVLEAAVNCTPPFPEREALKKIESALNYQQKVERPKGITAAQLAEMTFPEQRWAINGLIPEGATLLGGKPKMGKSLMAQSVGLAIASGGKALGKIDVEQGEVIGLFLEDTPRRLQTRLFKMLAYGGKAPDGFYMFTEWPRVDQGGIELLEEEIKSHTNVRLVIIDTLKMFRAPDNGRKQIYDRDYEAVSEIKKLADRCGVSILIIHHLRKSEAEDVMDTFSGSLGLTGAADGLMALTRTTGNADATLAVNGRDVEATTYAIKFDPVILSWVLMGEASEVKSTEERQKLYDAIKKYGYPVSPKELEEMTGLKAHYIRKTLPLLVRDGSIKKVGRGQYISIHGNNGNNGNNKDIGDNGNNGGECS